MRDENDEILFQNGNRRDGRLCPGEQPKLENLCKLNTNENAFPPSPAVKRAIAELDWERLRRYPDPLADALRDKIAEVFGLKRENVIAGNGSDDILTMVFRCFTSPELPMACLYPTYSLYPELAKMQGGGRHSGAACAPDHSNCPATCSNGWKRQIC